MQYWIFYIFKNFLHLFLLFCQSDNPSHKKATILREICKDRQFIKDGIKKKINNHRIKKVILKM